MRRHYTICLLLILLTLAAFWQTLGNEFVNYDDDDYVTKNIQVQAGLTKDGVIWAFTKPHSANWHPLTWLSHMLDYRIYKLNPMGHHLTNLLFHIANVLLLYWVLVTMTKYTWRSAFVAALFAVHPLHVESVAWVAERKDVLSTFFWMLTMLAYVSYVRDRKIGKYLLVVVLFALGLMSKPMLVTLPFALLLLDYWPLGRFQKANGWKLVWEKLPLFVLSAASSVVTYLAQQKGGAVVEHLPAGERIANALVSYLAYIGKMLWPRNLAVFYPHPRAALPVWQTVAAAALLALASVLVIRFARRRPYLATGWLWYLGTLLPVIGLVQVGVQAMADRYTYVPLIGLFIIIAWGVPDLVSLGKKPSRSRYLGVPAVAVIAALAICTWIQTGHWRDSIVLFEKALASTSGNYVAHHNLGVALQDQGRLGDAIAHYRTALRLLPDYADAHRNLAVALVRQGRIGEATDHLLAAVRINPLDIQARYNLGLAMSVRGKIEEAVFQYREALRVDLENSQVSNNLAWILATHPDPRIRNSGEAVRLAEAACRQTKRRDPADLDTLAAAYASGGRYDKAIAAAEEALALALSKKQDELAKEIEERLRLYESNQPYRYDPTKT